MMMRKFFILAAVALMLSGLFAPAPASAVDERCRIPLAHDPTVGDFDRMDAGYGYGDAGYAYMDRGLEQPWHDPWALFPSNKFGDEIPMTPQVRGDMDWDAEADAGYGGVYYDTGYNPFDSYELKGVGPDYGAAGPRGE